MTNGQPLASLVQAKAAGVPVIAYGQFLNNVLDFLIVAACIFAAVKAMNALKRRAPEPAPRSKECPFCCSEIPIKAKRCGHCTSQLA